MGRKIWSVGWRIVLCALLLAWIFNTIFTNEGKLAVERDGQKWEHLTHTQQVEAAWHHGPRELWREPRDVVAGGDDEHITGVVVEPRQ